MTDTEDDVREFASVQPTVARAWIDSADGRKLFVRAEVTDSDGNVISEPVG